MNAIHSYLSATLAVAWAALFAFLYTAYLNHLTSKNDIIKEYLRDLDEIERLCRDYWLVTPVNEVEAQRKISLGHDLRAKVEQTAYFEELSKSILSEQYDKFSDLDVKLYMTATGGTFQTSDFRASPERYGEIASVIGEIRNLLRSKRNAMFWAR